MFEDFQSFFLSLFWGVGLASHSPSFPSRFYDMREEKKKHYFFSNLQPPDPLSLPPATHITLHIQIHRYTEQSNKKNEKDKWQGK